MHNKIYKVDSTKTPVQARAFNGPATSGIEFDAGRDTLILNPDGTRRSYPSVWGEKFALFGANAQTQANYDVFFTAPYGVTVTSVVVRQTTKTSAATTNLDVKKAPSGTAIGSGTSVLAAVFDLNTGVNNTNNSLTLNATAANLKLASGDSLGCTVSQAPTALVNFVLTVGLKRTPDVA
jgi:hypothetical protein